MRSRRVIVFLDFQNVYHRARETFCGRDAPARDGQIDPLALGRLLAGRLARRIDHYVDAEEARVRASGRKPISRAFAVTCSSWGASPKAPSPPI